MTNVNLTDEQLQCIESIRQFVSDDSKQVYIVHGLAGTGKSTILTTYAQEQEINLVTFTGKASSVLSKKSGLNASTIHQLIYKPILDKSTGQLIGFSYEPVDLTGQVIGVDECSMVNTPIARDLLRTGAKIIAFGDPGQLPPVQGEPFFNDPDTLLETIHRQAQESAIVRQAYFVRYGYKYGNDSEDFRVVERLSNSDLLLNDIVLCYRNNTRKNINNSIRSLKGLSGYPKAGESIICLQNSHMYGLFNGEIYTLKKDFNPSNKKFGDIEIIGSNGKTITVPEVAFANDSDVSFDDVKKRLQVKKLTTAFDYGYCVTVHKSQGSEWDRVALVDEYNRPDADERAKWLYTGITRAAKSITVSKKH